MTIILATTRLEPETTKKTNFLILSYIYIYIYIYIYREREREREVHCITRPIKWAQLSMWSIPKIDVIILLKANNSLEYIICFE